MSEKTKTPEHTCCATGVGSEMWYTRDCVAPAKAQDPKDPTKWYCGIHARQYIPGYENPAFAGTTLEQRRNTRLAKQKAKHPENFCIVEGCLQNAFSFNGNLCYLHRKQAQVTSPVVDAAAEVRDLLSGKKGD